MHTLFENNRRWAREMTRSEPGYFTKLVHQHAPHYLWIGCADSRVPANEIVGLAPGELFVHRNVSNLVIHTDTNCLSVLQYAVDVLRVKHIIICGHYGCGGIRAALSGAAHGLVDNWLRHIQDIIYKHEAAVHALESEDAKVDRICELNVIEQAVNVCNTTVLQEAWKKHHRVGVHGLIYSLEDGLLRDLGFHASSTHEMRAFRRSHHI